MSGPLRVEKRGYSAGPWRIIDAQGQEVWHSQPYPNAEVGLPPIQMPMSFDTKAEAILALGRMAGAYLDAIACGRP